MSENGRKNGYIGAQVVMVVLFLVTAFIIAVWVPGDATLKLKMSTGYGLLVLVLLIGMVVLVDIIRGNINLSSLLSEGNNAASMSRFQLLIFTFVIALSLFMMVANNPKGFPEIPNSVLTLLGISASTYAVSKGITAGSSNASQKGGDPAKKDPTDQPPQSGG